MKFLNFYWNYETPTAALYDLTISKGNYIWFGFTIGRFFIGFMFSRIK